jgi:hypothetical protein
MDQLAVPQGEVVAVLAGGIPPAATRIFAGPAPLREFVGDLLQRRARGPGVQN